MRREGSVLERKGGRTSGCGSPQPHLCGANAEQAFQTSSSNSARGVRVTEDPSIAGAAAS